MLEYVFVDVQGLKTLWNIFVVEEIYILSKNLKFHEIIKPPYEYGNLSMETKKQVNWLEKNYHGISWSEGYITQSELEKTISPILKGKVVFVKGVEKVEWLKQIFNTKMIVVNLEDFGCNAKLHKSNSDSGICGIDDVSDISEKSTEKTCSKHKKLKKSMTAHCAVQNVWTMKKWFNSSEFKLV